MSNRKVESWKKIRLKGMVYFVVTKGLTWGIFMLFIMSFINKPFADGFTSRAAITHCTLWIVAGIAYGVILWLIGEWSYKKGLMKERE